MPRALGVSAKPAAPSIPASTIPPIVPQPAAYPTPPPSPDLEDAASLRRSSNLIAVQLDDLDDDDDEIDTDFIRTLPIPRLGASPQIPIPILLDTPHALPHAATFHLRSPASLLALVAGSRVLELDSGQTIWDRMPYSAAAAAVHGRHPVTDEDAVEAVVSGDRPRGNVNGLHWSMRHNNDTSSSIFVHPPTPERDGALPSLTAASTATASTSTSAKIVPALTMPSPPGGSKSMPLPLQVLPEVRSPPRRTIAMAADSLQLTQRRGRRPRLFGFTEMHDGSGSSAGSSAANSRQTSPERSGSPSLTSPLALPSSPAPGPDFIPRRTPQRARSETDLLTVGATRASAARTTPTITHPPPRRKENGLKLDFTGIVPLADPVESQSSIVPSPYSARLIRKKSGEILKPALKYGGPLAANGTPLEGPRTDVSPDSPASARFESKSCPTTPSCPKYVHFNPQLEQVKLFLHDQKPQVVSRGGSPSEHYTTSEGEEYPFPSTDEERDDKKLLQIKLPNFPTSHVPDTDLYLESLFLDDDRKSLRGMIMCKNYSYNKWVAVRFTFDFWQTTSEVTATYKDSVKGGKYDRFSFTIKLQDLMSRIEEKTMFLATRYTTDGREIWDSNGGQNYQVLFEKVRPATTVVVPKRNSVSIQPGMGQAVGGRTSQWSVTGGNADDRLADLRAKLSRLSADDASSSPPQLSPNRGTFAFSPNRRGSALAKGPGSPSGSPARTLSSLDARSSDLPSAGPALAARYDFGNALKTTRRSSPNSQKTELPEVQTGLLNYGSRVNHGHAATEFYSPRFSPNTLPETNKQSTDMLFSPSLPVDSPLSPAAVNGSMPPTLAVPDLHVQAPSPSPTEEVPTPTTSMPSPKRPVLVRSRTTPAVVISPRDSPPSLDTPTGSMTDTPSESPKSPPDMSLPKWSPIGSDSEKSDMSLASYSSFIEQFCWGGVAPSPPDVPRRTHSASSLDAYFASAHEQSRPQSNGNSTPRPRSYPNGSGYDSPGSNSSYYTSASTPTGRAEMDAVEDGLRLDRGSPRIMGVRMDNMGMGRMSPPVAC